MFTVSKYPHGTFCWADCSATDQDKAKAFYADIMGWESSDEPMGEGQMYTMFHQDGHNVAGLGPQMPGLPSTWYSYIAVDNVDALMDKVRELGGTVVSEPFDVFENGRMAVIQDPTGAHVSLWQARSHIGSGLVNTPGAMTWNELATRDLKAVEAFYSGLLGWTFAPGPRPGYLMFYVGDRVNGGVIQMDESWGDMPAHWMVYFSVRDIRDVQKAVPKAGGTVHYDIMKAEGTGEFLVIEDPTGAVSTMMQLVNPQPWTEA